MLHMTGTNLPAVTFNNGVDGLMMAWSDADDVNRVK